jgi:hypothetical protein
LRGCLFSCLWVQSCVNILCVSESSTRLCVVNEKYYCYCYCCCCWTLTEVIISCSTDLMRKWNFIENYLKTIHSECLSDLLKISSQWLTSLKCGTGSVQAEWFRLRSFTKSTLSNQKVDSKMVSKFIDNQSEIFSFQILT